MPRSETWKICGDADLAWRQWDGDYVVFDPASGNTHLLDIASGEVLMTLLDGPASAERIAARVADLLEVGQDEPLGAAVAGILESLDELGLIEPAEPC